MSTTPARWTKTTTQSGLMTITLDPVVVAGLDPETFAKYLTDQGWTRETENASGFDRPNTCACGDFRLDAAVEDDAVEFEGLLHHGIVCSLLPAGDGS